MAIRDVKEFAHLSQEDVEALGREFRAKGVNVALGPVVGPLGRVVTGGRNWEGFAADPYLCGALAYETVQGVQEQGVITSTKVCCLFGYIRAEKEHKKK